MKNLIFAIALTCLLIIPIIAQSGKKIENETPIKELSTLTESKLADETDIIKFKYEYIPSQNITGFMFALKEAGKRGFKLDKMSVLPSSTAETSKEKVKGTVLAGFVKYDGEDQFDYNFFFAEGEDDPEKTLNNLSKEGWYFRNTITVTGTGDDDSLIIEDLFANRIRKLPSIGNIYILERIIDKRKVERIYKLLKVGVGTGRNPTPKMQGLLEQAVADGFKPVGTYFSFDSKSLFSFDVFNGVIMEKTNEPENIEYKFVRGNHSNGLKKDIDLFSKEGFRIQLLNFNSAILVREPDNKTPVEYIWLLPDNKKYPAELTAALVKKPSFYTAGVYTVALGEKINNLLIFQTNLPPQSKAQDFYFAKIIPVIPKQFKKNPQEFLKTVEKPEQIFQKSLQDGYIPLDLYYSNDEGLMILFTKPE